jgi:ribosomal protein S18 acetylase RimI-like enzyme
MRTAKSDAAANDFTMITIAHFQNGVHRDQVIGLWESIFGYETAHNRPSLAIDKKLAAEDKLFFVAVDGDAVVGTVMAGYDGHRGWIYSMAVSPTRRREGIGSRLMKQAEGALTSSGCVKINLQVLDGNEAAVRFYAALGYAVEKRVSMGKRIPENVPRE